MRPKLQNHPTRVALVQAAKSEFIEHGWEAASITTIRARANCSSGSATHFFSGGKLQLGEEVYDELGATLVRPSIETLTATASRAAADVGVANALNALWNAFTTDKAQAAVFFELGGILPRAAAADGGLAEHRRHLSALRAWLDGPLASDLQVRSEHVAYAAIFGPCLDLLRQWAGGFEVDLSSGRPLTLQRSAETALFGVVPRRLRGGKQ